MRLLILAAAFLMLSLTAGCQEENPEAVTPASQSAKSLPDGTGPTAPAAVRQSGPAEESTPTEKAEPLVGTERTPPTPPALETFQGVPQIRLFPQVGDFRPAKEGDRLHHWKTLIEQLVKGTGIAEDQTTGNRGWIFPSIETNTTGYFSPFSVEPKTTYRVSFKLSADLPQGASAGIRIIEFNVFLWIAGQYTEDLYKAHFLRTHEGKRLTGKVSGEQTFTFTTGPDTHMIHLVLFRDGVPDGNSSMFDDIEFKASTNN